MFHLFNKKKRKKKGLAVMYFRLLGHIEQVKNTVPNSFYFMKESKESDTILSYLTDDKGTPFYIGGNKLFDEISGKM